jgi:hypothetical protein
MHLSCAADAAHPGAASATLIGEGVLRLHAVGERPVRFEPDSLLDACDSRSATKEPEQRLVRRVGRFLGEEVARVHAPDAQVGEVAAELVDEGVAVEAAAAARPGPTARPYIHDTGPAKRLCRSSGP